MEPGGTKTVQLLTLTANTLVEVPTIEEELRGTIGNTTPNPSNLLP